MKISELVPYKKTPAYNVAKQAISKNADIQVHKITHILYQQGYKIEAIGEGLYAQVFHRPGENYVIKIFKDDPGYFKYLKFILQNQNNPHIPKIRGKFMKPFKDAEIYLVRMELLRKYKSHKEADIIDTIESALQGKIQSIEALEKIYGSAMTEIIKGISNIMDKGALNDIHYGNVLFRANGTPVITDPMVD
jgi:hypothetical protein